jgi:hypothetical protein
MADESCETGCCDNCGDVLTHKGTEPCLGCSLNHSGLGVAISPAVSLWRPKEVKVEAPLYDPSQLKFPPKPTILKGQSPCRRCRSKEDTDLEIRNEKTESGVKVVLVCVGCKKVLGTSIFKFPKKEVSVKAEPITTITLDPDADKILAEFGVSLKKDPVNQEVNGND